MSARHFLRQGRRARGFLAAALLFSVAMASRTYALIGSHEQGGSATTRAAGHLIRQPAAVTKGLVGWWPFDGTGSD